MHCSGAGEPPFVRSKAIKYKERRTLKSEMKLEAQRVLAAVERAVWQVASVNQKGKATLSAPPPFTTFTSFSKPATIACALRLSER